MAKDEYKKSIKMNPDHYYSYQNLAKAYKDLNEINKSEETYIKMIKLDNKNASGYRGLGAIRLLKSELIDAKEMLLKSLNLDPDNSVVLSPDVGSARISQSYAKKLGMHFALIDKRRYAPNKAEVMHLIGDLDCKDVLIIDDMIDTAGTLVNAANAAFNQGAKSVTAIATHGVLSDPAMDRLEKSDINKIIDVNNNIDPTKIILPSKRFEIFSSKKKPTIPAGKIEIKIREKK